MGTVVVGFGVALERGLRIMDRFEARTGSQGGGKPSRASDQS
jgi:hypothetical protein